MNYEEFDKLIEEQDRQTKQARLKRIKEGLPYPAESSSVVTATQKQIAQQVAAKPVAQMPIKQSPASKWRNSFKNFFKKPVRLAACISMAVAVACLAIVLPFTLNQSGSHPAVPPTPVQKERYCYAASCKENKLGYSLKEYGARNNLPLLYVDWYNKADIKTSLHVDKEDKTDVIYYEEVLKHRGTGTIAELYVTVWYTKVDKVEELKKDCKNLVRFRYPYINVYWGRNEFVNGEFNTYTAYFSYRSYNYVLVLRYPLEEDEILKLVDSMLPVIR